MYYSLFFLAGPNSQVGDDSNFFEGLLNWDRPIVKGDTLAIPLDILASPKEEAGNRMTFRGEGIPPWGRERCWVVTRVEHMPEGDLAQTRLTLKLESSDA